MTTECPPPAPGCPVLVTGGAGFIGSHVVDALLALGHRVVVVDDLSTGDLRRVPADVRFVRGDVRDPGLDALLVEERIDTVFHLAAQVDVRRSVENPIFDAEVNVLGTIRVALAASKAGVAQVVFSSSGGAIYGDPVGERADEDHPLNPCSAYGVAKLAGEKYLAALAPDGGYLLTVLRYANVYGPRQDGRGEAGVVGIFMNRLLPGQDAVIHGDGLQTRDFIHVGDVVAALLAGFDAASPTAPVYNVCSGMACSVRDLLDRIARLTGREPVVTHEEPRKGEIRHSLGSPRLARERLRLGPAGDLDRGLRTVLDWMAGEAARRAISEKADQ